MLVIGAALVGARAVALVVGVENVGSTIALVVGVVNVGPPLLGVVSIVNVGPAADGVVSAVDEEECDEFPQAAASSVAGMTTRAAISDRADFTAPTLPSPGGPAGAPNRLVHTWNGSD